MRSSPISDLLFLPLPFPDDGHGQAFDAEGSPASGAAERTIDLPAAAAASHIDHVHHAGRRRGDPEDGQVRATGTDLCDHGRPGDRRQRRQEHPKDEGDVAVGQLCGIVVSVYYIAQLSPLRLHRISHYRNV